MMADCANLAAEKADISLLPLNMDFNRAGQMIVCNMTGPQQILKQDAVCADSCVMIENSVDSSKNSNCLTSQMPRNTSQENACLSLADRLGPPDTNSFMHSDGSQRILQSGDFDESLEYIDSAKETINDISTPIVYDIIRENLEGKSITRDTTKSAVIHNCEDSVLLESLRSTAVSSQSQTPPSQQRASLGSTSSVGSHTNSCRNKEDSASIRQLVNATGLTESLCGNLAFKPSDKLGKLIEGPRVTLPPSQLPVISSYPSPLATLTSGSVPVHLNMTCSQALSPTSNIASADASHQGKNQPSYAEVLQREEKVPMSAEGMKQGGGDMTNSLQTGTGNISSASTTEGPASLITKSTPSSAPSNNISSAKPAVKRTPNDFIFGKVIGEGSYSTVYLAKEVSTQREFAIKVCDKKHLIRERKTHFVMREKEVLMKLDHPFFIKLAYTFQDPERLYYVLTYARNGELLAYLHKLSAFDVPCTRFYSAEIVLALEYLHGLKIIHRDLKPENILIGEDMHIKITDFGTSKILSLDSNGNAENLVEAKRKNSFVGTAEYVSPEILNNQPANYGSDLWALGCIIYQCLSGSLPFRSGNEYQTFQKIIKVEYDFPEGFHPQVKDLVQKLLVFEPMERLGMVPPKGMQALKDHPFYTGIDWEQLPHSTPPKLMPYLPATASNPEFWGQEQRTGFDDQRHVEIITWQTVDGSVSPEFEEVPVKVLSEAEDAERAEKLRKQRLENQFHHFVEENLIIRQGFVDKRKGLFARKRMLLLTEGPHLYYVDAHNKVLKGEIPWSKYLKPEAKNFKIFFVHTPNRTYYLESRQPDAQQWVKQIKDIWMKYYGKEKDAK